MVVETVVKERRASGEREGSGERRKSKTLHFLLESFGSEERVWRWRVQRLGCLSLFCFCC